MLSVVRRGYEEGGGTGAGPPESTNNSFICVNLEKRVNKKGLCTYHVSSTNYFSAEQTRSFKWSRSSSGRRRIMMRGRRRRMGWWVRRERR